MSHPDRKRAKPGADEPGATNGENDLQQRFREALERKQAAAGRHRHADGGRGRGSGPASNEKVRRQFRRKSG